MTENPTPTGTEETPPPEGKTLPEFKNNRELLLYLFLMIRENRKWWLLPWLLVLGVLSIFVSLTGNASLLPAIYALF